MPALQVISSRSGSGRSSIAAGVALGFSRAGFRVRLVRVGEDEAAREDAASFSELTFASAPAEPVTPERAAMDGSGAIAVIEPPAGVTLAGLPAVLVVRGAHSDDDLALTRPLGDRFLGSIATGVITPQVEPVARDLTNAGLRPLALLPEDPVLASPSVGEIREMLGAEMLYDGENERQVVEDVLIAPVYADPARPHFRRFTSKGILAPYNKTDLLLAAIESQAACLIITGGRRPSPYVIDRAQHDQTTILLAAGETPQALNALGDVWQRSRFRGEQKAEAVLSHLKERIDFTALARRL
jgi:BioD-like phosphotransacetylase family protein